MAVTIKDLRFSISLNSSEAKKSASDLQASMQQLGDEMKDLSSQHKKDTSEYREKKKALAELKDKYAELKKESGIYGYSMQDLSKLSKTLRADLNRMVPDSNEWNAARKDLLEVDKRIEHLKETTGNTGSSLSKLSTGFNKYFGIVASGVAIFAGLISKMDEYNEKNKQLEVSQKNLQSLTGLSDKDTGWVTKQAAKTSTGADKNGIRITQNSQEIIDAMTIVGSQRAELLKNKEALLSVTEDAMKMSIASKDTLEASTEALTNTMNQFNLEGSQSTRIINSLAAGSLVGAGTIPYLSQAIEKAGTTANLMGISVENTIGIIEGVAPKFKQAEVAGNSLDKVLMIMKEKQIGYASGVFNMNDALLELKQRYDKGETSVSIFGREHAKMGEVLVQAREKINEYTLGVTGTNVAIEQAAKNSDTSAAKEAQATNRINEAGMALAKNMNGIKLYTKEIFANLMETMSQIAGNTKSATEEFDDQSKKVVDLKMNIEPLLKRYDELASKANKSTTENAELKRIVGEVTSVMPGATTAVDKYGNAISISTGRVREWIGAEVARMGVVNRSAIEENKKALTQIEKDLIRSKQNIDEINKTGTFKVTTQQITGQGAVINTTGNASSDEVKAEQEKYRQLIQDKLGYQSEIERLNGATLKRQIYDAKKAQEDQAKIDEAARLKALEDAKNGGAGTGKQDKIAAQKKKIDSAMQTLENENLEKIKGIKKKYLDGDIATEYDYNQKLTDQQDTYDGLRKKKLQELLKTITDPGLKLDLLKQVAEIDKKSLDRQIEQNNKIKKLLEDADLIAKENESYDNRLRELGLFGKKKEDLTKEELSALQLMEEQHNETMRKLSTKEATKALKQLEKDQQTAQDELADRKITDKMSEQAYKDELLAIEIEFLKKKLAINGLSADEIDKITKQLNQKKIDEQIKQDAELQAWFEKNGIGELARLKNQKEIEIALIKKYESEKQITAKQATKLTKLANAKEFAEKLKGTEQYFKAASEIAGNFSGAFQGFEQAQEKAIETKYQKQIDAAKKAGKDTTELEDKKNKEIAELRAKNADKMFALNAASIISSTAVAAIDAYAAALKVPGIGLVLAPIAAGAAVLYGGSQLAIANEERKAAKAGYYTGGYTGDGGEREPAGVVHKGEFVANAKAVRNPQVKKFLDVFNAAQLNGSIHMLNTTQILEKVRAQPSAGYQAGGYVQNSNGAVGSVSSDVSMAIISENARQMERLNAHLDKGILSYSVVSGDYGSVKQTERYVKMKANASR